MGKAGHEFALVSAKPGVVIFENAGDDRVRRISYALSGDGLVGRVEFREAARVEAFRMRRVRSTQPTLASER
jgi:hypothetical protein